MRQNRMSATANSERRTAPDHIVTDQIVKDILRATRKSHSAEEKIRVAPERLRGEYSIPELCRWKDIAESLYNFTLYVCGAKHTKSNRVRSSS